MSAADLWVECYQGEVLGETLYGWLAARQEDPERRRQLEVLTRLERTTRELAEPVFERRGLDRGDTSATVAAALELADAVAGITWDEFLAAIPPIADEFLDKYRRLVEVAPDRFEREIAEAYVSHELALATFARRALGEETGEPLQLILSLPHVAAADPA